MNRQEGQNIPNNEDTSNEVFSSEEQNWEQRFKDTQSAYTKANQEKVELAMALVEANPNNIEIIKDEKVRNKILQDKWGVDNLEELKILFPNYNKTDEEVEDDKLAQLEKKIKIMEYQSKKVKTNEAIKNAIKENETLLKDIPDYELKILEELKYISPELSEEARVNKALKLVMNTNKSNAPLYATLQGVKWVVTTEEKKVERKIDENLIKNILNGWY